MLCTVGHHFAANLIRIVLESFAKIFFLKNITITIRILSDYQGYQHKNADLCNLEDIKKIYQKQSNVGKTTFW